MYTELGKTRIESRVNTWANNGQITDIRYLFNGGRIPVERTENPHIAEVADQYNSWRIPQYEKIIKLTDDTNTKVNKTKPWTSEETITIRARDTMPVSLKC